MVVLDPDGRVAVGGRVAPQGRTLAPAASAGVETRHIETRHIETEERYLHPPSGLW